jgi:HD-like signal output (HDOD) protein
MGVGSESVMAVQDVSIEGFSNEILGELHSGDLVLPMLPEVTLRVSDMAADPDASLADLADLIRTDPTLSSQLIKVSNSPLYRGRQAVDSVPMAVSRLGFKVVKNLVSSLAMQQMFSSTSASAEQRLRGIWDLNTDVSARCQVLAGRVPGIEADEAMLAGLIYNIGVLPLLTKAERHPELFENDASFEALVDALAAPIGVAVLVSWDFPVKLINVVEHYPDFERNAANEPELVDVVQVASLQSHLNTRQHRTPEELAALPAFRKLDIQTDVEVDELDENSEEYAAAMAMFR